GALADGGPEHERVGDGAVVREVVLRQQHAVIAEALRQLGVGEEVAVDVLEAGLGARPLSDQEGPDPHRPFSLTFPASQYDGWGWRQRSASAPRRSSTPRSNASGACSPAPAASTPGRTPPWCRPIPRAPVRPGQRLRLTTRAFGLTLPVTFDILEVDPERHLLHVLVDLPLGLVN